MVMSSYLAQRSKTEKPSSILLGGFVAIQCVIRNALVASQSSHNAEPAATDAARMTTASHEAVTGCVSTRVRLFGQGG